MLAIALLVCGAEPAPQFEVVNKVPAFTVTNRVAAPARMRTADGSELELRGGVWWVVTPAPVEVARPAHFPAPSGAMGTLAQPAVVPSTGYSPAIPMVPIRTGAPWMGPFGGTGSYGVGTLNCSPGRG